MNDDNAGQQLITAIEKNHVTTASSLISSGVINLKDNPEPLHKAALYGRREIVTLLLDAGADIDLANNDHMTACHYAIVSSQFDTLKLLVERGANVAAKSFITLALQQCRGDQILTFLLDAGTSIDNLRRSHLMALVRSVAMFKRLLARGVNVNTMNDESGFLFCHYIAGNVTDEHDFRFLLDVCGRRSVNFVNNHIQRPLHWAAQKNNSAPMRVLVELGADIDAQDRKGWTALHVACNLSRRAPLSGLESLLALGIDVFVANKRGQTAFNLALGWGNKPAFDLLVAAGGGAVDLDLPTYKGKSLRMSAKSYNVQLPTPAELAAARKRISKVRFAWIRRRAAEICIGLQQLDLSALQLCEIMTYSFGVIGSLIAFHEWWTIATKVKHFKV